MLIRLLSSALMVVSLTTVPSVLAHHSDAALKVDITLTLNGRVTAYSLRNPHAYVTVEVVGDNGTAVSWDVQMASGITMRRLGWLPDSLQVGEQVTFSLSPARDGRPYGLLSAITKANGEALVASPRRIGASPETILSSSSIFGRWLVDRTRLPADYPGGLDQLMIRELTLQPKGREMEAAYSQDSADNPELSCISKPTPAMIIYTDLYPMDIATNADGSLTLRSQYFDMVRTVYMDGRSHPPANQLFHEGHSVGRWEGDQLIIDTTNFSYHRSPYQNGIPSGPQKHVEERYRLIDSGTHLEVAFTLEDPEYIEGGMQYSRQLRFAPDADMSPFNCDLESTRRFLPSN